MGKERKVLFWGSTLNCAVGGRDWKLLSSIYLIVFFLGAGFLPGVA